MEETIINISGSATALQFLTAVSKALGNTLSAGDEGNRNNSPQSSMALSAGGEGV